MGNCMCECKERELHTILTENAKVEAERSNLSGSFITATQTPTSKAGSFKDDEDRLQLLMQSLSQLSNQLMESKAWQHDNFEKVVSESKSLADNLRKLKNRVSLSSLAPGWPVASDDLCQLAEAELERSISCLNDELSELKRQVADLTFRTASDEVSDEVPSSVKLLSP
mmetsp:Transcript_34342/g.60142  ORF Transcript_34342/g.60142 Transcript_34342/m.60142 type:complete len:169 (+) Transcript_34342:3056-3562(+)|eukprot:CAMPEP_0204917758 /NCGR_PEP_ID=MMETSP1397-20131031/15415_1 /ASSEMBLY_ACC=CAM_ASM_000891 /TAXON_ID=49980 /ORGANISM="Climacostomum Climacostomum virens, Strain Stock W-24" /LENGTH=168 /DNA_ID=CAMNT_0052090709 /DNA_START=239 /DNA_END=745 /DNA_ORIENTATION=+